MKRQRDIRIANRSKRPKLPPFEISKLENFDRPLGKDERGEMSAGRKWGELEAMGLMKKEPIAEVGDGIFMMTVTASPKTTAAESAGV